jgi:hypothetical protein
MSGPVPRGVLSVGAVGFLVVVAGIVVTLSAGAEPVTLYGGSYTPVDQGGGDGPRLPWAFAVTAGQLTGVGLALVGMLLLAGVAGWLLGADSRRRRPEEGA